MLVFNPVELAWSDVSNRTSGGTPSPRSDFGFALAGNKLYVHGGYNPSGDACAARFCSYKRKFTGVEYF
jgi:hypothetical protein